MIKQLYTSTPDAFPVCQHAECPLASECLHQLAFTDLLPKAFILHLLNPERCTADGSCPHYRSSKPVTYARGLTKMQKQMYPDQYNQFKAICISRWGRTPFFERRRGECPLSPAEQEFVKNALTHVGVTAELKFDSYEQNTNWYD